MTVWALECGVGVRGAIFILDGVRVRLYIRAQHVPILAVGAKVVGAQSTATAVVVLVDVESMPDDVPVVALINPDEGLGGREGGREGGNSVRGRVASEK
jgi:hypothetical protein